MRTASHLHSTDELADGRHHVIPCPVPGHEGQRDSPGLDVEVSAKGGRPTSDRETVAAPVLGRPLPLRVHRAGPGDRS